MDVLIVQERAGTCDEVIKSTKSVAEVAGGKLGSQSLSRLDACDCQSTSRYELSAFNSSPTSNPGSVAMFGFPEKIRFKQVAQPEDCESLIQNQDVSQEPTQLRPQTQSSSLCTSFLWFIAFPIIALLGILVGSYFPMKQDTICIKRTSQYCKLSQFTTARPSFHAPF